MNTTESPKIIILPPQHVCRFRCEQDTKLLMSKGSAEIYGTEFPLNNNINLPKGYQGDLITFYGCTLQIKNSNFIYCILSFSEDRNCWNIYLNIHTSLENLRNNAVDNGGPRVMICGDNNTEKRKLSHALINYRIRKFEKILFIDTNVNVNDICIPSSLGALIATEPYNIIDGWSINDEPLIFNFGYLNPLSDPELYMLQLKSLSDLVDEKLDNDPNLNKSGFILNMSSFKGDSEHSGNEEQRLALLQEAIDLFQINYVLIVDDGFLEQIMKSNSSHNVKIINIPKSSEVSTTNESDILEMFQFQVSAYFKGQGSLQLRMKGYRLITKLINIYSFGSSEDNNGERFRKPKLMKLNKYFHESYLAVSQATKVEDLATMPIYGYVMITEISPDLTSFKVITPFAEPVPSYLFLYTEFKIAF